MARRPRVLILVNPDGFVEVFHEPRAIQLKVVEVPLGPDLVVEQLVENHLGRYWSQMYWPSKRRRTAQPCLISPEDRLENAARCCLVEQIKEVGQMLKKERDE